MGDKSIFDHDYDSYQKQKMETETCFKFLV